VLAACTRVTGVWHPLGGHGAAIRQLSCVRKAAEAGVGKRLLAGAEQPNGKM
jgi:hypothetical protein